MYSAEEYARCLNKVLRMTEAERKATFDPVSYPSDSYLMSEIINIVPADKFVEAVKRYELSRKKVTWVDVEVEMPGNSDNHFVTLFVKNQKTGASYYKVCTGWYDPDIFNDYGIDMEGDGEWNLSDGYSYSHYADHSEMADKTHVVAWSREIPETNVEPYIL